MQTTKSWPRLTADEMCDFLGQMHFMWVWTHTTECIHIRLHYLLLPLSICPVWPVLPGRSSSLSATECLHLMVKSLWLVTCWWAVWSQLSSWGEQDQRALKNWWKTDTSGSPKSNSNRHTLNCFLKTGTANKAGIKASSHCCSVSPN